MDIPKGYKRTEIGVIPEDWEAKRLGELAVKVVSGGTLSTNINKYWDGQIAWCTPTDITALKGAKYILDTKRKITQLGLVNSSAEIIPEYSLVVTTRATIGECAINKNPITTNQGFKSIILNKDLCIDYLYYKLQIIKQELIILASGSTFFEINKNNFVNISISVPVSLPEQKLISQSLSDVDELITSLEQLIIKKRNIKQGTMQQLLTGKKRLEGFSGEWEEKMLGEIAIFSNGKAHENDILEVGKFIVINSKFVSTQGEVKKYSDLCLCAVYSDEIVMVMSDVPNGKAIAKCFFVDENNKYTLNQRICSLKAIESESNPNFLFYLIDRNSYFLAFDDGVKQTNLRKNDILNCPLKIPDIKEQKAIGEIFSNMDAEIGNLEKKRDKYKAIKQGMMQELLTGRVRLIDSNIESDVVTGV